MPEQDFAEELRGDSAGRRIVYQADPRVNRLQSWFNGIVGVVVVGLLGWAINTLISMSGDLKVIVAVQAQQNISTSAMQGQMNGMQGQMNNFNQRLTNVEQRQIDEANKGPKR